MENLIREDLLQFRGYSSARKEAKSLPVSRDPLSSPASPENVSSPTSPDARLLQLSHWHPADSPLPKGEPWPHFIAPVVAMSLCARSLHSPGGSSSAMAPSGPSDRVGGRSEGEVGRASQINLNANESPWDNGLNRYPEQQPPALIAAVANYFGVNEDQALVTRGSDEGIDCLVRLFCQAQQDSLLICPPTFGMYTIAAQLQGAEILRAPLQGENYSFDAKAVVNACQENTKLVFLCSPNNPTGQVIPLPEVKWLCEQLAGKTMVVVDEAYMDFADEESAISLINQFDNCVVLRTFSKSFGLAAARVGVLLAQKPLIDWLQRILAPYPIPATSAQAVLDKLQSESLTEVQSNIATLKQERDTLLAKLQELPIVQKIWPSDANFILLQFSIPVFELCQQQGILLRDMSQRLGVENVVRISIGTPEENKQLITILKDLS